MFDRTKANEGDPILARDLIPGDQVDLEGDTYADDGDEPNPAYEFEYGLVESVHPQPLGVEVFFYDGEVVLFPALHSMSWGGNTNITPSRVG